ncbi:MAG: diguanylate cyclase [Lachnospiraceae bacterium]|nr:diguanylate cyclase [Lachnospiraceae bacterium]
MQQPDRGQPLRILIIFILLMLLVIPLNAIPARMAAGRLSTLRLTAQSPVAPTAGTTQVFTCELPHEILPDAPALMLQVLHATVSVECEGETLYTHAYGRRYHFVPLRASDAGKTLTIRLTPSQERAYRTPFAPLYGEERDLVRSLSLSALLPFLTAILLSVYGVVFLALSLFLIPRVPGIRIRVYTALIMVISGVWMLCYHGFFELLSPTAHVVVLEYSMIYLAVPVFFAIARMMKLPLRRHAFFYITIAFLLFCGIGAIVVMQTNTFASGFLLLYFFLCSGALAFTTAMFLRVRKQKSPDASLLVRLAGFSVYLITCLIHILCYFLYDYNGLTRNVFSLNAITIGAAALLESQLIDYFLYASTAVRDGLERPELLAMAYRDFLTKLPNRADAERVFSRMARTSLDFCVVMLDLNGLKTVNDKNGHDAGDRLIVNFARVLRVAFGDGVYLARLGGDEFVAVLEGASGPYVNRHLQTLDDALLKLDAAEPDIHHSVSYGYAFRHECAEENGAASAAENIPEPALRRAADREKRIRTENVNAASSRYAKGNDILQRVMALADLRMYTHKRLLKSEAES